MNQSSIVIEVNQRLRELDWSLGLWVVAIEPEIVVQKRVSNRDVAAYPADPWRYESWDINQEPESIIKFIKLSVAHIKSQISTKDYLVALLQSNLHESIKRKILEANPCLAS